MARIAQDFVPIEDIKEGIVILKNGELRLIMLVSTVNFDLKSTDEQNAILMQYQDFLNSLDFPVQVYVQSRQFDIRPYIAQLEDRLKSQTNDLLRMQMREYILFVKDLTESNNIMSKMFFVVIPYYPAIISKKGGLFSGILGNKNQKKKLEESDFQENRSQIEQRRDIISGGLARMGLKSRQLGNEELIELFYKIFNPGEQDTPTYEK